MFRPAGEEGSAGEEGRKEGRKEGREVRTGGRKAARFVT